MKETAAAAAAASTRALVSAASAPRRAVAGAAALALLAGCATSAGLAPRTHVQSADRLATSSAWAQAPLGGRWPSPHWWTAFGDPQLDRLIEEGLAGSPTLQAAEARTRLALAQARAADAAHLPDIEASGSSLRERFPGHALIPPPYAGTWNTLSELSASLAFDLDPWGQRREAQRQALGTARAAELDADAARIGLSAEIAHTYVALERAWLERDVEQTLLAERAQIYALTRQRNQAGIDSKLEVKEAESALPDARERITRLDERIGLVRNALAALVGQGPDRGAAIGRPHLLAIPDVRLPARLPAELIGRRPDILALQWRIEAARHGIAGAKAAFYPNVDLTALVGLQALGTSTLFAAASREIGVGPALSLPIFDGGRRRAQLAARDAQYDIAVSQYDQAIADALREVADQLVAYRSLDAQRAEQRDGLATAQDAYDLALLRYRDGVGNYLQVLTTHAQLLGQRSLEAELRARAWDVSIDLERALGGGFVPASADAPPVLAGLPARTTNDGRVHSER